MSNNSVHDHRKSAILHENNSQGLIQFVLNN